MDAVTSTAVDVTAKPATPGRFAAYLYTQFFSAFNDNVHAMAIGLYLAKASGKSEEDAGLWQSVIGAAFVIPFILLSPLAGSLADRYDKRKVLILAKWTEVIPMSVSFLSSFLPAPLQYYGLVLGIFLMEVRAAFFSPAKYGILAEISRPDRLVRANGVVQMLTMVAIVTGEAVGGFAFQGFDIRNTLLLCLGISVVGSLLSTLIPGGAAGNRTQRIQVNPLGGIWNTVREMRSDRMLVITVFTLSAFWMVSYIFKMNIPVFGRFALAISPGKTSLLWAFVSIGIGIGAGLAGVVKDADRSMGLVLPGIVGMAAASGAAALWGSTFKSAGVILAFLGVFGGLYLVPQTSIFQARSPSNRRGAYLAVQNFANYGFMLVSAALYALIKHLKVPSPRVFLWVGVGLAFLALVQAALQPSLLLGQLRCILGGAPPVKKEVPA
jgi:acyl-[acyl-carrier-protein]-phospholipid O-acyltransferase/long-chain-fatty-acid--[acyl-carrier-protein] ligase